LQGEPKLGLPDARMIIAELTARQVHPVSGED
jgi:hypothetical protein